MSGPVVFRASDEEGLLRAAFRDAHGARLNGFALLVTLGDTNLAGSLAAAAIEEGSRHADALRHPERAAAWLRGRVLKHAPARSNARSRAPEAQRREALAALGVDAPTYSVLAALNVRQRAALVASEIEGFEPLDMEIVLGSDARTVRRLTAETRRHFLRHRAAIPNPGTPAEAGLLAQRLRALCNQVLGRSASRP